MGSKGKAKKILKAFGKEEGKARLDYIDSFLPEKTSFIGSISYKHTLRRVGMVVLLTVLALAVTVSAYAAVIHYLNYTKTVHQDNDEYVSNNDSVGQNGYFEDIIDFYEPKYIPEGYALESSNYNEDFQEKEWYYTCGNGDAILIQQVPSYMDFHIDNERSSQTTEIAGNTEINIYETGNEVMGVCQYESTLIIIKGNISVEELKEVVLGIVPQN